MTCLQPSCCFERGRAEAHAARDQLEIIFGSAAPRDLAPLAPRNIHAISGALDV